jgi:hypothetical protein
MKKLLTIAAVAACTGFAMSASAVVVDFTATNSVPADNTGASYVTTGFTMPTSTGVSLFYNQNATIMAVGASNAKGSDPTVGFGGSTEGGVIAVCSNVYSSPTPIPVQAVPADTNNNTPGSAARSVGC